MSKKTKTFTLVILIIAIIIVVAAYAGNRTPVTPETGLSSSSKAAGVPLAGENPTTNDFSASLSTIKGISIDTSIFTNSAYLALRDYPVALGTDTIGRTNPFAPVGADSDTPVQIQVQFETIQPGKITKTTAEFGAQGLISGNAQVVFEYGTSDLFGSATPPVALGKNGTALYSVTGLTPGMTYYVRAVLAQGSNTTVGNTMTFTTSAQ